MTFVYFLKINFIRISQDKSEGPILYLALHRNGAVDGFVYASKLPRGILPLISAQLRRSLFLRFFFYGIEVVRDKDKGDRSKNREELTKCVQILNSQAIFIFPEGTSSLGPKHLPFKSGAAYLISQFLQQAPLLNVVPLGIHYCAPDQFGSSVDVVEGEAIQFLAQQQPTLADIKQATEQALLKVGFNVETAQEQQTIEQLATIASIDGNQHYFTALKAFEKQVPETIQQQWQDILHALKHKPYLSYHGTPVINTGFFFPNFIKMICGLVIVINGFLMNIPPILCGFIAAKKFADDRNVVSLWRLLIATPVCFLWVFTIFGLSMWSKHYWIFFLYVALSIVAAKSYDWLKLNCVQFYNALFFPRLKSKFKSLKQQVEQYVENFTKTFPT